MPVCDIRIVDPTTRRPVPTGQTGLLLVRGPQVMKCYYGDPGEVSGQGSDSDNRLDPLIVRGPGIGDGDGDAAEPSRCHARSNRS